MKLFAGLGNPGAEYARHRHNVGFMVLDRIAEQAGSSSWRNKFQAQTTDAVLDGVKCVLLKPQTFMNESGRSIREAARFYKIEPEDVIVFHDEVDLAPGKVRVKQGGGVAGHNGLKSVAAHLGPDFGRVRIGVGHPGHKDRVPGYVLHDFSKAEMAWLEPLIDDIAGAADRLAAGDSANFMNQVARKRDEAADKKPKAKTQQTTKQKSKPRPAKNSPKDDEEPDGALAHMLRRFLGVGGR